MSEIVDSEIEFAARLEDDLRQFWQRISKDDRFYGEYKRPQPPVIIESQTTLASARTKRPAEDEPADERRLGACCDGSGNCTQEYMHTCAGTFLGELIPCDPNPCGAATGACCASDGTCTILSSADCGNAGGMYQGDGTGCSPNPCPQPTGACCHSDGSCSIETATECTDVVGGTYQGDNTVCDPNPCATVCPFINLTCDSISASKSKCGYASCSADGKFYLTKTKSGSWSGTVVATNSGAGVSRTETLSGSITTVDSFDGSTCVESLGSPSGSLTYSVSCTGGAAGSYSGSTTNVGNTLTDPRVICVGECCNSAGNALQSCRLGCSVSGPTCSGTSDSSTRSCTMGTVSSVTCQPSGSGWTQTYSETVSDEYTTATLISNTEAALPTYSGMYTGGACAASRFLNMDESTYSIQRSKPKFEFTAATGNFTICYNEHFVPANGDPPTNTVRTIGVTTGQTEAFGPEILEPSTNGTTTVENVTCALEGMTCTPT